MAAKKRSPQKQRGGNSPNTVLVIFLVFFVLLSVGLGVGTYYGFANQDKFEAKAKDAQKAANAARKAEEWALGISQLHRRMVGDPLFKDDATDEDNLFQVWLEEFLKPDGKFKDQKTRPIIEKALEDGKKVLGWNDAAKKFVKNYRDHLAELKREIDKLKADLAKAQQDRANAEALAQAVQTKYDALFAQVKAEVKDNHAKAMRAAQTKFEEVDKLLVDNRDLTRKFEDMREAYARLDRQFKNYKLEVEAKGLEGKPAEEPMANGKLASEKVMSHALLLDISRGKTFWDLPVGKILRVDPRERKVHIDKGSVHGVQPFLTFNVFAAGWEGKAEGPMKGTIEVVEVDRTTSVARITSMYDREGREINLNVGVRGAALREADNSMKQGDLLYNLTWGSQVAIAGAVNWSGFTATTPAEEMRHLRSFMSFLAKQGVGVDAYLDLTDGQLKGMITPKTRFLILGSPAPEPSSGKEGEDNPQAQAARAINDKIAQVKKEAQDRGLLIISHGNFAHVIGFRPPRSGNEAVISEFQYRVPFAGTSTFLKQMQWQEPKMKDEEKMNKDEKMEKKEEKEKNEKMEKDGK